LPTKARNNSAMKFESYDTYCIVSIPTGPADWVCHTGTLTPCRGGCLELYYCNMVEWSL